MISLLQDLRLKTAILESLGWDEDLFQAFLTFFGEELAGESSIEEVLLSVKNSFGEDTYNIVVGLFKEEALNLDRYIDDTEH